MPCKALIIALLLPLMVNAQNLVPNWSFEEYEECPDGMAQIEKATGWMAFRVTPDYFNSCASPGSVGVPHNVMTTQRFALDGQAFAGIVQIALRSGNSEVIGIELENSLVIGQEYYLSFYVSRGTPSTSNCWANKIGAKMSTQAYSDWPLDVAFPITNEPHVHTDELVSDTINWTKIEGFFTADSAYNYLSIGNHFELDSLQIVCDEDYYHYQAYYFVDCICLTIDAETCPNCEKITSSLQSDVNQARIKIFPNPFNSQLQISFYGDQSEKRITLFGIDGRKIDYFEVNESEYHIDSFGNLAKGLYILMVEFENGIVEQIRIIKK